MRNNTVSEKTPLRRVEALPGARPERSTLDLAVSVVVPCKNDARYLAAALDSILGQDYPLLECIVVDGGSTDRTPDVLRQYGDRISWISEPDRGAFDAINKGWRMSRGEILTWLNADDLWEPGAVRAAVRAFARHPDVDVVYGHAGVADERGNVYSELVPGTWNLEHALSCCDHVIAQPASFIRRPILEKVGWLHPAWCHDHDLWLRIAYAGGRFMTVSERLAVARARATDRGAQLVNAIPAKLALTKRFFDTPDLPMPIRRLERRARSSACALSADYVRLANPRDWLLAARFVIQAVGLDPGNMGFIAGRVIQLSRRCLRASSTRARRFALQIVTGAVRTVLRFVRLVRPTASTEQRPLIRFADLSLQITAPPGSWRRVPGWHTRWGIEAPAHPFLAGRLDLWSALREPAILRWYDCLLVALWPDNEISRALFVTGLYEPNELLWMNSALGTGMTMIDVGANMGLYTMVASRLVGSSGTVIAVEPSGREFQRLAFHVTLNDLRNVQCIHVAASDAPGAATLRIAAEQNAGHNTLGTFSNPAVVMTREERVLKQTVDAIAASSGVERVDLVKIDVEGHELSVLRGGAQTLSRFRPRILVEVSEEALRRHGASASEVFDFLKRLGYLLHHFSESNGKPVPLLGPLPVGTRNILALPR